MRNICLLPTGLPFFFVDTLIDRLFTSLRRWILTTILVTHNWNAARQPADRSGVANAGRLTNSPNPKGEFPKTLLKRRC